MGNLDSEIVQLQPHPHFQSNLHALQPVGELVDGVGPLLQGPLQEGHHVRLVLTQLQVLLLQLLVPLFEPKQVSNERC